MARNLAKLLGDSYRTRIAIDDLRRMAGDDSDVRLIADILARANSIIRWLGLDPADTTGDEVYQALMAAAPDIERLAWAKASDWVMMEFDGQIISFHPIDIVENYHYQLPLGQHRTSAGKRGLGYEITRRFSEHPRTHTPSVERVVCEGGICWIESVTSPAGQPPAVLPTSQKQPAVKSDATLRSASRPGSSKSASMSKPENKSTPARPPKPSKSKLKSKSKKRSKQQRN